MELSQEELKKIYDEVIKRICQNGWANVTRQYVFL